MTGYFFFLFLFICTCFAYEQSSIDSNFINNENQFESREENKWQTNYDEYIDQMKTKRASHQHEQALLAEIYSPNRIYVSTHDDRVHPSNFTYFTFKRPGTYRFILITTRGDADLYISTKDKHVTYNNYEYSSCTCGIDEILIDSHISRPIHIGVYGYSQYQPSDYRLLVELIDSTTSSDQTDFDDEDHSHSSSKSSNIISENETNSNLGIWDIIAGLLEILEAFL